MSWFRKIIAKEIREAILHGDNDEEEQKRQKIDSCSIQKQFEAFQHQIDALQLLQEQNNKIIGKDSFLGK